MNKIFLIIQREYFTRVRKKSFIIMSFVGPLLMVALSVGSIALATMTGESKVIEVIDMSGLFKNKFVESDKLKFVYIDQPLEAAKTNLKKSKHDGILYIPELDVSKAPTGIMYISYQTPSFMTKTMIEKTIKKEIEDIRLLNSGIRKAVLDSIRTKVDIATLNLDAEGTTGETTQKSSAAIATGIGYISSFLIYFFIFIYGTQVMRGVIEEKTNRIVEIIISSVKPFQLMMGKIIGIAGVALTQFLMWVVLSMVVSTIISQYFGLDQTSVAELQTQRVAMSNPEANEVTMQMLNIKESMASLNIPLIVAAFGFYFIFGYLLYGALLGAVGAAVDNETDTQQFILPVTIPLIAAMVMSSAIIQDPNSSLAFWASIFPLTSPVIMMIRLPFIGGGWELALSMVLLVAGFVGAVWIAGRIYRVGILMYGKKVTYKELGKWLFYKA